MGIEICLTGCVFSIAFFVIAILVMEYEKLHNYDAPDWAKALILIPIGGGLSAAFIGLLMWIWGY